METFATHSEAEALILEQQLIKEYKPKFNILLRDDKTYPFIYFLGNHDFPSIHLKEANKQLMKIFLAHIQMRDWFVIKLRSYKNI